ncbi:MAG: hypothetical protein K2G52_09870 [Muribaculaceae bacterium]|nr:hypothetical protein [Muribaculaceae bacterium]
MKLAGLLIAVVFMFGCSSQSSIEKELKIVNYYADNGCPEKGLAILDSLEKNENMEIKHRMYAGLLRIKTLDKLDIIPTNDSSINKLLHYYIDEGNERNLHPIVLYYAGRTYIELKNAPKALLFLHKALDLCPEGKDPYMCSYIHSQMAGIFDKRRLYKMALRHHIKEFELEQRLKDSVNMVYTQTHIAICYRGLGERDSAEIIYKKLLDFAPNLKNNNIDYYIKSQIADFLMEEGRSAEADSLLQSMQITYNPFIMPAVTSVQNKIDMEKGRYDEVKSKSLMLINKGDIFTKRKAAENLSLIYLSERNLEEGLKYAQMYKAMSDTITHNEATDYIAELEAIYNYTETEMENQELKLDNAIKRTWVWFSCSLAFLAIAIGIYFYFRHLLKESEMKLQIEENKQEMSAYVIAKDQEIADLERKKNSMGKELAELKKLKISLENELSTLKGTQESTENELDKFRKNKLLSENELKALKEKNSAFREEIKSLRDRIVFVQQELSHLKDERMVFENKFQLAEVSASIIGKASVSNCKVSEEDFLRLEKAILTENPNFINSLRQMHLRERDLRDAMLIVLNVPLKVCATILNLTPQGIANARKRLFKKIGNESMCANWIEYIWNIYEKR